MQIRQLDDVPQQDVTMPGATGARMRMLIGPDQNAGVFHMRHFAVAPGGHTPRHSHDYEHEILVLRGQGMAFSPAGERDMTAGDVIWVPPNEEHQFRNTGDQPLEFICLIPAPRDCTQ